MKQLLPLLLLLLLTSTAFAQEDSSWVAFQADSSELIGFKDPSGKVRIEPKFMGYTHAYKFDKLLAAMEESKGRFIAYYLTKAGRIVGRDSLYTFDNGADCESEGFIRFSDPKTGLVGMFNSRGDVAVPAVYNSLSRVENGLIVGLKGARKKRWPGDKHAGCEHFSWEGGQILLLDTTNQLLVADFPYTETINLFSLEVTPTPPAGAVRQGFKGVNGQFYSFIDYKKEFQEWFSATFTSSLTRETFLKSAYPTIHYWKESDGWVAENNEVFLSKNFDLLTRKLTALHKKEANYALSIGSLNVSLYDTPESTFYYNNCGEALESQFPVISLVVTHHTKSGKVQDHFNFFRTAQGYKLISLTLNRAALF